ncbi:MAG: glycoside hydrolase family 65 protein [Candidatus Omnitrophica bacterium]|nr:glycoside hydrolase family 65 protein [Candidatus Omnitrophota bacterium]
MKDYFAKYRSDDSWLIKEDGWDKKLQSSRESQFALGNGFIGSRGILEEVPFDARPGTYIAGLYDKTGAQVTEIVNLPNPINLRIVAGGELVGAGTMDILEHERILDMRHGLLMRHTLYRNSHKKRFDYQSLRFVSMRNKHIIAMQTYITPLDEPATLTVENFLDLSVTNVGFLTEGNKKHFRIEDVSQFNTGEYLAVRTLEKNVLVAYGKSMIIEKGSSVRFAKHVTTQIKLKKNQTVCITTIFSIFTSDDKNSKRIKPVVKGFLKKSANMGFQRILEEHIVSWDRLWQASDVKIKGAAQDERSLHFNLYHLLVSGREGNGESSIGAKTLSGEGYRGHIFWDAEIFIFPFFLYSRPKVAKNMLLYRYNRLEAARRIAQSRGYKGAMFPWESAGTGEESTPAWAKNFDGSLIQIRTHEMEHHITADIAYAVYQYYVATQDIRFMLRYGFEIIFETARFWASRVEYNKKSKKYEINHVIGPDEFHEDVDNNAYTNSMAHFNLLVAYGMHQKMKRLYPEGYRRLSKKIGLKKSEPKEWKEIAPKIVFNLKRNGLIEQFDRYFRKKKIELKDLKKHPVPPIPKNIKMKDIDKTQLVKQADVVMLLYLFSGNFTKEIKKRNFYYYLKRTVHKSSLSAAVHAALAAEIGENKAAYRYFDIAANMDLTLLYGNTNDGMHAASLGVTWQAVIHGFAGIRIFDETLSIDPRLPEGWKELSFCLKWQGYNLKIAINHTRVGLQFYSKRKDVLKIKVFNTLKKIEANKAHAFIRERGE